MTHTIAFAIGFGVGSIAAAVTVLVTLSKLGKAKVVRTMKAYEARQRRGKAILDWLAKDEEPIPFHITAEDDAAAAQFLIDHSGPADNTPRDGLDT